MFLHSFFIFVTVCSILTAGAGCPAPEPVYDDQLGLQAISVEKGSLAGTFAQKHSILSISDLPVLGEQEIVERVLGTPAATALTPRISASLVHEWWTLASAAVS